MESQGGYVKTPTGPFHETIARAARLGFDGVEILSGKRVTGDVYSLREALKQNNLEVAGFNSGRLLFDYGMVLLCGDSRQCSLTRSSIYELIRLAGTFSSHINIGMFRGFPIPPGKLPSIVRLISVLRQLADYAQTLGVELLIEPANKEEFPFISSTAEGIALVERVNHSNIRLMLDTFHMATEVEDICAWLERAMPYLRHIHFLDLDRNPPTPNNRGFDLTTVIQTLTQNNYQHYLSMPLFKRGGDEKTLEVVAHLRSLM